MKFKYLLSLIVCLLLLLCCIGCNNLLQKNINDQIYFYVVTDLKFYLKNPNLQSTQCKKIQSQSTILNNIYVYSFYINNPEQSITIKDPMRVYYRIQLNKFTGKIKILDRTVYVKNEKRRIKL